MRMVCGNVERIVETEAQARKYEAMGYKWVEGNLPLPSLAAEEHGSLDEMTVAELKALAKTLGLSGVSGLNKDELKEVIWENEHDNA